MEFWFGYNNWESAIRLAVPPESFTIQTGKKIDVLSINDLGDYTIPNGDTASTINIKSFFPEKYDSYCDFNYIVPPYDLINKILWWKSTNRPIRLLITDTNINLPMLIESFNWGERAGTSDVEFEISLKEYRFISVERIDFSVSAVPQQREASFSQKKYIVKKGDTLWLIAKKLCGNGDRWKELYEANKNKIGFRHLITVGQELISPWALK